MLLDQLGGRYFLYLETIHCMYLVPHIAELISIFPHAYLEVVMSSIQKESEPTLVGPSRFQIGFDPINLYFTCFACCYSCVM